ncbi:hypothetical protein FE257_010714 [Aspergillus nanangensis]|uniref:Zn(2)-C6 fungal-type domain-containing protein n=1 Tax=Aspergillus nanangensis TaxID=2582783 RepID=A0AAD4CIS6_ASPNN|nr:hypothetical protein FE257_010714 [Aspergillus nanangensis]
MSGNPSASPSGANGEPEATANPPLCSTIPAQDGDDDPVQSSLEPTATSKRGRYVARACFHCQKRKIRCSGTQPCQHCRNGTECRYPDKGRRSRNVCHNNNPPASDSSASSSTHRVVEETVAASISNNEAHPGGLEQSNGSVPRRGLDDSQWEKMASRLGQLERNIASLTGKAAWGEQIFLPTPVSFSIPAAQGLNDPIQSFLASTPGPFAAPLEFPSTYGGAGSRETARIPSFAKSIETMDHPNRHGINAPSVLYDGTRGSSSSRCPYTDDSAFASCCERDMVLWSHHNRVVEIATLRDHFRTFFDGPNTHYPCINEPFFHAWFETLVSAGSNMPHNPESMQFLSLINLMTAVVKVLEHLLNHVCWAGKTSFLTIQCLIIKASYLLYIEKPYLAYDTVAAGSRVMYQIGLHNERSWRHHSKFESVMHQRVFWSLYCLDRAISLASGAPCIIQDNIIQVDMPPQLDDRLLLPGTSIPMASPTSSSVPYLQEMVSWAHLYSETCKTVSQNTGQPSRSSEILKEMDEKVLRWLRGLPGFLTWSPDLLILDQSQDMPHFILRHAVILLLRGNYLRLLIRQEDVIHREYSREAANLCIGIATHSINVVHLIHSSFLNRPVERYSSVTFLAGAMIPLICVIMKENTNSDLFSMAVNPFKRALGIIQSLAGTFPYAHHTLARLGSNLSVACKKVKLHNASQGVIRPPQNDMHNGSTGQGLEEAADFSRSGEGYPLVLDDMLLPHITAESFSLPEPTVTSMP